MSYECERVGDTWLYLWHEYRVGFHVGEVKHTRGDLNAYITVQQLTQSGEREGLLAAGHVMLDETSATVDRLVKKLQAKDRETQWDDLLGVVCHRTRSEYLQGTPCIDLGTYELPPGPPQALLWPVLTLGETTIIYGDGGSLKSVSALCMGLSIATDFELPGFRAPLLVGPVLYVDYESHPEEHARRMGWILKGWGVPAREPGLVNYRQQLRSVVDDIEELKRLRESLGARLVVYDSAAPACGGDPNDAAVATALMNAMREIGGTRLLVAHVTAASAQRTEGVVRPFGSTFFWNLGRSLWEVQATEARDDGTRAVAFYHRKSNGQLHRHPVLWSVKWTDSEIQIAAESLADTPTLALHTTIQYRIREALRRGAKPTSQIAEELDQDPKRLSALLRQMPDLLNLNAGGTGRGNEGLWGLR